MSNINVEAIFALDHFGVVADPLLRQLLSQDSNKRARKVAFNSLVRMLKATKQIAKSEEPYNIGLVTDAAGQVHIHVYSKVGINEHNQLAK